MKGTLTTTSSCWLGSTGYVPAAVRRTLYSILTLTKVLHSILLRELAHVGTGVCAEQ